MDALGERFRGASAAKAMLTQRSLAGSSAQHLPAACFRFGVERGEQHAGTEQGDAATPQARPRAHVCVFGDQVLPVSGDDPRGDVFRSCAFSLGRGAGVGGVIGTSAPVCPGQGVFAVRALRPAHRIREPLSFPRISAFRCESGSGPAFVAFRLPLPEFVLINARGAPTGPRLAAAAPAGRDPQRAGP